MTNDIDKTSDDSNRAEMEARRFKLPREPFPLNELANYLPRKRGKKLNRSTIWRWAQRGCRGAGPLETFSVGSVRYVTPAAVRKFLADCDAEAVGCRPPRRIENTNARQAATKPSAATLTLAKRFMPGVDITAGRAMPE